MSKKPDMLQESIAALTEKIGTDCGIDACWTYDLGPDGYLFVDCKSVPHRVLREQRSTPCVIALSLEDLWQLLSGKVDSLTVFTQGKIRLTGDMALVVKIDTLLGTYRVAQGA